MTRGYPGPVKPCCGTPIFLMCACSAPVGTLAGFGVPVTPISRTGDDMRACCDSFKDREHSGWCVHAERGARALGSYNDSVSGHVLAARDAEIARLTAEIHTLRAQHEKKEMRAYTEGAEAARKTGFADMEKLRTACALVQELAIVSGSDLDGRTRWCRVCHEYLTRGGREYPHAKGCRADAVAPGGA